MLHLLENAAQLLALAGVVILLVVRWIDRRKLSEDYTCPVWYPANHPYRKD